MEICLLVLYKEAFFMRKRIAFFLAAAVVLFAFSSSAYQVVPMNLEQIISKAAIVFRGVCKSKEVRTIHPAAAPGGVLVTHYVFSVTETLKGTALPEFDQYGVPKVEAQKMGVPYAVGFMEYKPGQEYVVALTGPTDLGVYAPMGMAQGVFDVRYDAAGKAVVVNGFSNANLFNGKGAGLTKALKATKMDAKEANGKPVSYDDFKKMVDVIK